MNLKSSLKRVEREARSRMAKIVSSELFVQGSLVEMARVCGKKICKCTRGEKHVSLYLSVREGKKRKLIYIPKEMEGQVQKQVEAYQKIKESMEIVSSSCIERLLQVKEDKLKKDD